MKSFSSSPNNLLQLLFLLILLTSVTSNPQFSQPSALLVIRHRTPPGPAASWARFHVKRTRYPPPPRRDDGDEIDPRYGVAKRLVPSGPNPLHN
ncbi:hypothetical protein ACET3Z_007259 [Daucus carota]